jgi:hypothetical protein
MGSSTAIVLAVTWAGVVYSWRSWKILLPLILGVTGLVTFFVYEAKLARYPVVCLSRKVSVPFLKACRFQAISCQHALALADTFNVSS